jgi:hypothetical protein
MVTVAGVSIFLAEDSELLSRLCTCDACMAAYAAAGVVGWFYTDEDDVPATDVPRKLVPAAAAAASGGAGTGASADASALGGSGSASSSQRASSSGATAASESTPTPASSGGAGGTAGAASLPPAFRTTYDRATEEFGKLPVTMQLDMLNGYNDLSADLLGYLRRFAEEGVVVTEEHIKQFFAGRSTSHRDKRRRLE